MAITERTGLRYCLCWLLVMFVGLGTSQEAYAAPTWGVVQDLRLVPFPKQIKLDSGGFKLQQSMIIEVSASAAGKQAAEELKQELSQIAGIQAEVSTTPLVFEQFHCLLCPAGSQSRADVALQPIPSADQSYKLVVKDDLAAAGANSDTGLVSGIQTLRQLIRANMKQGSIPCLRIEDWPSLKYRGFQDDLTRGPSSKLETLEREVRIGSLLKMNFFTYYMEYQYAFEKHPLIGPKDGSLTPDELRALVQYAKNYQMEIIGNQQSFGHFGWILRIEKYKHLRETPGVLNPTNEETYKLLDDLYSEQIPILESQFFNVCCDETFGLGQGPSKPLADKIGVGGVYAQHMQRVHELITKKYGKRMMMWGDIILHHPEHLEKIPKDTVMLSWGYHAEESFDNAIIPFAKSGYDFFVCPGVNCWKRILPDFHTAVINIRNYVRDGVKNGALGMLNTTWDDDGESFFAPNWHGVAWGAECAWNASTTSIEDFDRRIGAVLFGEEGDHFGQAVKLLGRMHFADSLYPMMDKRFWKMGLEFKPSEESAVRQRAAKVIELADSALEHLRLAQKQAKVNADLLDYFIFGTERARLMPARTLDVLDAANAYKQARSLNSQPQAVLESLRQAAQKLQKVRDEHENLRKRYIELWNRENKPYALDWVMKKFDVLCGQYDAVITKLQELIKTFESDKKLPADETMEVEILKLG